MLHGLNGGTLSGLELLWILVALIGAAITTYNTVHAHGDYQYVKHNNISNGRRIVARTAYWTEAMRLVIQVIFLIIGVMAAFIPDPSSYGLPLKSIVIGYFIRVGLIVSSILLTVKSEMLRRMRRAIHT